MPTTITTDDELLALLGTLGDNADEVADTLRAADVKGVRKDAAACPIARWLTAETTDSCSIEVDHSEVFVSFGIDGSYHCDPPLAVSRFLVTFDDGDAYQDLLEVDLDESAVDL